VRRLALTAALLTAVAAASGASPASAQEGPAGAVQGHFVASPDAELGGALTADLWYPVDLFRFGGFVGVGAVPSDVDTRNRVFMPLGVSVAFEALGEGAGVSIRARGGLWGGATQEVKLTAGGFVGGGAYLLFDLGAGTALSVGLDVWGLFGDGETVLFAPSLGLSWNPSSPAEDDGE
jgi:hypothetical protein